MATDANTIPAPPPCSLSLPEMVVADLQILEILRDENDRLQAEVDRLRGLLAENGIKS